MGSARSYRVLKWLFGCMSALMAILVVTTSSQSNLFALSPVLTGEPWFAATLVDFYFNIVVLSAWVIYKETNRIRATVWTLAFVLLGSIATCLYVFLQLARLKPWDSLDCVVLRDS